MKSLYALFLGYIIITCVTCANSSMRLEPAAAGARGNLTPSQLQAWVCLIFSYATGSVSCACAGQPERPWPSQFRSESAAAGSNGDQTVSVKRCPHASDREDPVRVTNEPEPTSLSQLSSGSLAVTVTVAEIHSCLSTLTRLLRVERLAPGHRDEPEPPSLADRGGAAP